jgi:hypothetical protein
MAKAKANQVSELTPDQLSGLTPEQRLAEAQTQYAATIAEAKAKAEAARQAVMIDMGLAYQFRIRIDGDSTPWAELPVVHTIISGKERQRNTAVRRILGQLSEVIEVRANATLENVERAGSSMFGQRSAYDPTSKTIELTNAPKHGGM